MSKKEDKQQQIRLVVNKASLSSHPTLPTQPYQNFRKHKNSYESQKLEESIEQQDSGEDSSQQQRRQRDKKLKEELLEKYLKQKYKEKMVVGTGFSMDITDFFKFEKKKDGEREEILDAFADSRISWFILLISVTTGAAIPGWIMNIEANKLMRKSWRFFMQSFMMIPFALYEMRTGNETIKNKYSWSYILNPHNLRKPFVASLAACLWFTVIISAFQWTFVSHSLVLGSLSNLFLSFNRSRRKQNHDLESGGQILAITGIALVFYDSITLSAEYLTPNALTNNYNNLKTYKRQWYSRLFFDIATLTMSYVMTFFSKYTVDLKAYYPPFLSMLLVNLFNCLLMTFSCFFFNGTTFDFNSFWGIFALFSNFHFAGFMYMAIILSLSQLITVIFITRLFPDPIIPALVMTLEPFIAGFIVDLANVQHLPTTVSLMGYILIFPGLLLILVGQCLMQRQNSKKQKDQSQMGILLKEFKEVNQRQAQRQAKDKQRKRIKKENMEQKQKENIIRKSNYRRSSYGSNKDMLKCSIDNTISG